MTTLWSILDLAAHVVVASFATWLVLTLAGHVALRLLRKRPATTRRNP